MKAIAVILAASVVAGVFLIPQAGAHLWNGIIACDPVIESLEIESITGSQSTTSTPVKNIFDKSLDTRWSDNAQTSWFVAKLDKPKVLCSIDIAFYHGDERVNPFKVYVSKDGSNYQLAYDGKSSGTTEAFQHFVFNHKYFDMQYVKAEFAPAVYKGTGTVTTWTSILEVEIDRPNPDRYLDLTPTAGYDDFGIKEIYATKNNKEWYVNMDNPTSDPRFENWDNVSMQKMSDGSWRVSADQIRLEAWSPNNDKWLNVEITEYAKVTSSTNPLLQMYSRGGHHTSNDECLGSAYKSRLYIDDGRAAWVKEVTHPAYAGNRGTVDVTDQQLMNKWVGFKAVIYNVVENGKTYVRMENYVDLDVTDSSGNLVVKNNWQLASVYTDKGGWSTDDSDFTSDCAPLNKDSTQQYRQRDEIMNTAGNVGQSANLAAWRTDDTTWQWKYLSVREIVPPTTTSSTSSFSTVGDNLDAFGITAIYADDSDESYLYALWPTN